MSANSPSRERDAKELDAHFKARREEGLPAHRPQEHHADVEGVEVHTLAGYAYVNTHGEKKLDQAGVFTLIKELQAAYQAVS
jgi:quercetin dioxygenase-like cupin family protein